MGRLALLSVSDKSGLVEFAQGLVAAGFAIVSSGGTAQSLKAAGVPVTKVSDYTGSPEILGGRVKTLHPKIHGGILARRDVAADLADLEANGIAAFDLVAVNLYPFAQTVAKPGVTLADAIENIDIGGPAMIRATAKNFSQLTVLCNPSQYPAYLAALQENDGVIPLAFRQARALEAFEHTASYDAAIVAYLSLVTANSAEAVEVEVTALPAQISVTGQQVQTMRYGENPHQAATWYASDDGSSGGWATAKQLQGKELSYNNLVDLEAARQLIAEFGGSGGGPNGGDPAAAILKHNNPCGVAQRGTIAEAYQAAFAADSTSAFGGIVALNRGIDAATAQALTQTFLECVVAPSCDPDAAAILAAKPNLRILTLADLSSGPSLMIKPIAGGFLAQAADDAPADPGTWTIATEAQPTEADLAELLFAWQVVRHVKSNAIVITQNRTTLGVGAGQMNRVGSAQIALTQAGDRAKGAILASDGFFPFDDSVRTAAAAGIRAIVQPGGSMRDADSVKAANELGVIMMLTGQRHFLH
jgi:phosphoribosylaminoimidazolecarboxamide formyltransferase / IMP cyclohydrolase